MSSVSRSSTFCSKVKSGEYPTVSASAPGSLIERTKAEMRPSSPRSSRISSTVARYSRSSSRVRGIGVVAVRSLLDLDAQHSLRVGLGGADDAAVQAAQRDRAATARQPHPVGHLGDRADARVVVFVARDEQHALLRPDVHGQGHIHVREDDDVLHRDEQHRAQHITPSLVPVSYQH